MSQQRKPVLVVLNGASSSGKTSTAQALKPLLGAQAFITGFDDILERVRPFGSEQDSALSRSLRILWFQLSDGRLKLFKRLHQEIAAQVHRGSDVILETALMDTRALHDAAATFAPLDALFVGMKPPLEVSEAWEAARKDRPQGQARKHYNLIHAHNMYDLIVDPSIMTPQECAQTIMRRLAASTPTAFRQLLHSAR